MPELFVEEEKALGGHFSPETSAIERAADGEDDDGAQPPADVPAASSSVISESSSHGRVLAELTDRSHLQNSQGGFDEGELQNTTVEVPSRVEINHDALATYAQMTGDGRVHINIDLMSRKLTKLLERARSHRPCHSETPKEPESFPDLPPPSLNIVIQVVGSRGDVQPFVALGRKLKEQYHHRARLATHANFKGFVEENGLEFFNIGGDPAELMAFMVKNPGLVPGLDSLRRGDVGKRQREIFDILIGCWRSCIESGDGIDLDIPDGDIDDQPRPFVADAIIANPPSFAHIHCAEKLGIPVHLMFTMPWSPTEVFPHPLASVHSRSEDSSLANVISYTLVEALTWQGLGHVINRFRQHNLRLEPVSLIYAPDILNRLNIPYTYCWSPSLIPKPKDWGNHISVSGFYFLSLASSFNPDPSLLEFLEAGPPPVYIGFGSIVVDDPNAMTTMIFDAVKKAGVRALVSKGWGGLGKGDMSVPEPIYMLGNVPHDWLFKRVSCVVHHGGAGTTAAGIALGKPTVVVPFFGDQPFWGAMIARAGAGPSPVPYKKLTADILAASITAALQPSVQGQAAKLAASIVQEKGTEEGAEFFHRQLKVDRMRCSLAPNRVAVWRVRRTQVRLSALAAAVLIDEGLISFEDLKLHRPKEYDTSSEPPSPLSGVAIGVLGALGDLTVGVSNLPVQSVKSVKSMVSTKRENGHYSNNPSLAGDPSSKTLTPASAYSSKASTMAPTRSAISDGMSTTLTSDPGTDDHTSIDTSSLSSTLVNAHPRAPIGTRKLDAGPGTTMGHIVGGILRSPAELIWILAKGYNNAPKLYGDTTVRHPDKITDFRSGVKMAGKGLGYGLYDGFSGLVTQPVNGAKGEGVVGFMKGVGKGIGGVLFKPTAAILGVPGYTYRGIYKELRRSRGKPLQEFITAARTAEGLEHWSAGSTKEEREGIVAKWHQVQEDSKKKNKKKKEVVYDEEPAKTAASAEAKA